MATKRDGCPCYDKAADDEPLFVLRAQDVLAARTVRAWCGLAYVAGVDSEKIAEAERCADLMDAWETKKKPD